MNSKHYVRRYESDTFESIYTDLKNRQNQSMVTENEDKNGGIETGHFPDDGNFL